MQVFGLLLAFLICTKRENILSPLRRNNFELKFEVLFKDLKDDKFPLFYFIFFGRRLAIVLVLMFLKIPVLALVISGILNLAVLFI